MKLFCLGEPKKCVCKIITFSAWIPNKYYVYCQAAETVAVTGEIYLQQANNPKCETRSKQGQKQAEVQAMKTKYTRQNLNL